MIVYYGVSSLQSKGRYVLAIVYVRTGAFLDQLAMWVLQVILAEDADVHASNLYLPETNDVHEGLAHQSETSNVHEGLPIKLLT